MMSVCSSAPFCLAWAARLLNLRIGPTTNFNKEGVGE